MSMSKSKIVSLPNHAVIANRRCPRCGSTLLTNGTKIWCSFVGGGNEKACAYGIDEPVTLPPGGFMFSVDGQTEHITQSLGTAGDRFAELERLSAAVIEARRAREAIPHFITIDGQVYVNNRPEVTESEGRLREAEKEWEHAIREGGHELLAEVRRLRRLLKASHRS